MPKARFWEKRILLMWLPVCMLAALLCIVVRFGLIHPDSYGELEQVWGGVKTPVFMAVGVVFFILFTRLVCGWLLGLKEGTCKKVLITATVLAIGAQLFLTLRYPVQIWWDNTSVLSSAISIVTGRSEYFDHIYFNQLGHQNCFLMFTALLYLPARAFGIPSQYLTLYYSLFDVVALDLSAFLMVLLAKRIKGREAAVRMMVLLVLCPGMYLWCSYYYTTNVSLLFMSLFFYMAHRIWEKKQNAWFYLLFGLVTAFGCQFRATMLLCVVAAFVYAVFRMPQAPVKTGLYTLVGAVLMIALLRFSYAKLMPAYDENERFPVYHWLMMAAQGNGEYNDADLAYTSSFATSEEKAEATKSEYIRRLKEMGPGGVAALCIRKTTHNWAYGNHSYYPMFQHYDRLSDYLWVPDHQIMFYLEQIWHLTLLVYVLMGVIFTGRLLYRKKWEEATGFDSFMQIALLGGFCFYMLWETFPYYSVGFMMLMVYIAEPAMRGGETATASKKALPACAVCLILVGVIVATSDFPGGVRWVVTQKKQNEMYEMKDAACLQQTFLPGRSFDTIRFWIAKKDMTNSEGGVYDITLRGDQSGEVLRERYDTGPLTQVDEYIRTIQQVDPAPGERFTLSVTKVEGGEANPLTLGTCHLPVRCYSGGAFYADGQLLSDELFFTVSCGGADDVIRLYQ